MAMSRSIGGRSFTTRPSMLISPELISSSPAPMRKVVLLPQPEGPTSTTNSRARISRLTSGTACTSSYILFRFLRTTSPISALHASGHAGDVIVDEEGIDDRHRDRADQRAGHQRPPEEHVAADQLRHHAHRDGLLPGRRQEHQRVDALVSR